MFKIQEGDVIKVNNPLRSETHSYFRVFRVEGNRAYTHFRVFNAKVYPGGHVYEYGKERSAIYNNEYVVVNEEEIRFDFIKEKRNLCRCVYCTSYKK